MLPSVKSIRARSVRVISSFLAIFLLRDQRLIFSRLLARNLAGRFLHFISPLRGFGGRLYLLWSGGALWLFRCLGCLSWILRRFRRPLGGIRRHCRRGLRRRRRRGAFNLLRCLVVVELLLHIILLVEHLLLHARAAAHVHLVLLHEVVGAAHVVAHVIAHPLLVVVHVIEVVEVILLHAAHHLIVPLHVVHALAHHLIRHLVVEVAEQGLLHVVVVEIILHKRIRAIFAHRAPASHGHRHLLVEHCLLIAKLVLSAHHARVRLEIVIAHLLAAVVGRATSAGPVCHGLAPLDWLVLGAVAVDHADVVRFERDLVGLTAHHSHSSLVHCDGLVQDAHVGVHGAVKVLQILHLTLEHGQVVCEHLPIELLANVLLPPVLLILLLSGVIYVAVKLNELVPLLQVLAHVVHVLLADLKEVFPTREIVEHDDAAHFVEELLLEVLALIEKLLDRLGPLRQHQVLGLFVVVAYLVELLDQGGVLHFPLFIVLLLEQLVLLLLEELLGSLELELRALHQEECFLETCSALLALILELGV